MLYRARSVRRPPSPRCSVFPALAEPRERHVRSPLVAGLEQLGLVQIAVRGLQRPVRSKPEPHARRPRVRRAEIEVVAMLVGFAAMEYGSFEGQRPAIDAGEHHAARQVCRVEYMVRQRRRRILRARRPVHERRRTECGVAHRRGGKRRVHAPAERHAPRRRQLHEEIVRMLMIRDLKSAVRLALLEDRRVAGLARPSAVRALNMPVSVTVPRPSACAPITISQFCDRKSVSPRRPPCTLSVPNSVPSTCRRHARCRPRLHAAVILCFHPGVLQVLCVTGRRTHEPQRRSGCGENGNHVGDEHGGRKVERRSAGRHGALGGL